MTDSPPILAEDIRARNDVKPYYTASSFRFITLNVVSFNFYGFYWLYRNWEVMKTNLEADIKPIWRTLFAPFFIFSFGYNVKHDLWDKDLKASWNPAIVGVVFIVATYLYNLPGPYALMGGLAFLPLLLVQNSMKVLNRSKGFSDLTAKKLVFWKKLVIICCYIVYFFTVVGLFILMRGEHVPNAG